MTTVKEDRIIIDYWFRVLIKWKTSIEDIVGILLKFADINFDLFDKEFSNPSISIDNDYRVLTMTGDDPEMCNAFGKIAASASRFGKRYHWKLKIIRKEHDSMNIGIIESSKVNSESSNLLWWGKQYGYAYCSSTGHIYNGYKTKECCTKYGTNDVIDVYLGFRENKNELFFAKNGRELLFGRMKVKSSMEYKLVVS